MSYPEIDRLAEPLLDGARAAVRPMSNRLELGERLRPYQAHRWGRSLAAAPVLHLDDFSELPFLDGISGVEDYQHRARLRARETDLLATVTSPTVGYEEYCRERLGLSSPEWLVAEPRSGPMAIAAACSRGEVFDRLVEVCRRAPGLRLHPFMGIEPIWSLAQRIAAEAGAPVEVLSPPPPVTWIANDKALFGEVVARALGEDWLVETRGGAEPEQMARHLELLSRRHRRVALKRLRCVSGMGNAIFESAELAAGGQESVKGAVREFLERTGWQSGEEVLAVAWEEATASPSTQLWIPPLGQGAPRLDGIYEQILIGEQKVFVGSRPSTFPAAVNEGLGIAALQAAAGLQALGYVGRCSFDHLLLGDPEGEFRLRFVECNGRWGGTSIPMDLLDRLLSGPRPPYRAQDFVHSGMVGRPFSEVLERVGEQAFDAASGRGRFIFYNVGPLAAHGKLDVIAMGHTQAEAERAMGEELPRLLGL